MKILFLITFFSLRGISVGSVTLSAEETTLSSQNTLIERQHQLGFIVVTPQGPQDGGDFGPNTPGTNTSGLQEAFDLAKRTTQDVYIVGGNLTHGENQGVVYFLDETLRIPWMQDFRIDGGEYVIQYRPTHGDAITIDSAMSCNYKFGIISSNSDGPVFRIKPASEGPDRFQVFTTTQIHINALVGGGGAWLGGEAFNNELDQRHDWKGIGLLFDGSTGSINDNKFTVMEIVGCDTAMLLKGRCSNNWIDAPFLHLSRTSLQLGTADDHEFVTHNRIRAAMDSQGIAKATGASIFGSGNILELTSAQTSPGRDLVWEAPAQENLVLTSRLNNGITNNALKPTNRVVAAKSAGFTVATPNIPLPGETITNRESTTIEIMITKPGQITSWTLTDTEGESLIFNTTWQAGQSIRLAPGESLTLQYQQKPDWKWRSNL
ncbi:MAG: hypothetical protein KDA65_09230 [Planctomycetaceae bacterium]|nr:hypothetical protein [Planctomycetaceae bacterium]